MPRDGGGHYHAPPGTDGAPNTTIDSARYNLFVADLEQVLNTPAPIIGGGTGGATPDEALDNLSAEKKGQVVTNFDSMLWESGSFSSSAGATNPPVAGHAFAGIVYATDDDNIFVEARDVTDGKLYLRQKNAGVWGAWGTGSGGSGASVLVSDTPPSGAPDNSLWWESDTGSLYILYNDGTSTQWVIACPQPEAPDLTAYLLKAGDTMTGLLTLSGAPTAALHAATKTYVDSAVASSHSPASWTRTVLTAGPPGTYTTKAGCKAINVRLVGPGGGGAGGVPGGGAGGVSTATTFGSLSAGPGGNGGTIGNAPAVGGTCSGGDINQQGNPGMAWGPGGSSQVIQGGIGASGPWGGGGYGGWPGGNGSPASPGSGAGGGGGGGTTGGNSGASGGYCEKLIANPAASYAYSVPAGGTGGAAGTSNSAPGGAGGSGIIIIDEYY